MIILSLLLGIFLRVYGILNNYAFDGELGRELLYLRQNYVAGHLPLVGLTTSHEWLSYGPFYYWIMMPIYAIFKGNPFILFWVALTVFAIGLVLSYYIIKKIAGKKIAFYSSLLQSISPLLIWQTTNSKLHVFFFIFIPVFMYLSYLLWNGKKRWVFWTGLIFGLMFSFHFSQIPLLGVLVLLFWVKRNIYKIPDYLRFIAGVIIPNITLIWQDRSLALWLPYRTLNLADKNPTGTLGSFLEYFGRTLFWDKSFWIAGTALFVIIFAHYVWINREKFTKEFLPFYLISSIGIMLLANIIHGAFPIHYFLPIFMTTPVLFALFIAKYKWGVLFIILLFAINLKGYFNFSKPEVYVPYFKQMEIADFIISEAKGEQFSITRVGPYDYFPEKYAQNYKYLILWKGGNLVENSPNIFTIVEYNGEVYVQK